MSCFGSKSNKVCPVPSRNYAPKPREIYLKEGEIFRLQRENNRLRSMIDADPGGLPAFNWTMQIMENNNIISQLNSQIRRISNAPAQGGRKRRVLKRKATVRGKGKARKGVVKFTFKK